MHSVADVITELQKRYEHSLIERAVSIFTPLPDKVALRSLSLGDGTKEFIRKYEPRAESEGLFLHQSRVLEAYRQGAEALILTSATGSGKSLCFWAWVMDQLLADPKATALVCFPTQALMWGQAERLARVSDPGTQVIYDERTGIAYGGTLSAGGQRIGWSVWKGRGGEETPDLGMRQHENSPYFLDARIRVATLDKAHWSLIGRWPEFTKRLCCVVLDEAHQYDGMFGANVAGFLRRLYVAKASSGAKVPRVFLASATLSDAKAFASRLTSLPETAIHHEKDAVEPKVDEIGLDDAKSILARPPQGGLLRVALFNDVLDENSHFSRILADTSVLGDSLNVLYFSDSKFASRMKRLDLDTKQRRGPLFIYDADLPPEKRRAVEAHFNRGDATGSTLIATNALELGVDIENLDACVLQSIPVKRADLLQRIGRVGRRQGKPGLVLMSLSASPLDRYIRENLKSAFSFDAARSTPIPTHLRILQLTNTCALETEVWGDGGTSATSPYGCTRSAYRRQQEKYLGEALTYAEALTQLREQYGGLVDTTAMFWTHKGFRASVSLGKTPLRVKNSEDVAWIEDINIFRDAHPEAVYLDDKGRRWRVCEYDGKWQVARWEHPESDVVLGKYLKGISVIYVQEEREPVTTRGLWEQRFEPYQLYADPPEGAVLPENGELDFGVWEYTRRFNGYEQINLRTKTKTAVSLAEVTERFKNAVQQGSQFPFLFPLTYRTYGWSWDFSGALTGWDDASLEDIQPMVEAILQPFIADAIQTSSDDLDISLDLAQGRLDVRDAAAGGNGLSEGLLSCSGIPYALQHCVQVLQQFVGKQEIFRQYLLKLCGQEAICDAEDIIRIAQALQDHWAR